MDHQDDAFRTLSRRAFSGLSMATGLAAMGGGAIAAAPRPPMGVRTRTIEIATYDGQKIKAFVAEPAGPGRHPAIGFGMEAMGLNTFNRKVATDMAARGYVTITPDYYRGASPSQPDNYDDLSEVREAIAKLDFVDGTHDVMAGIDWLRVRPNVDPDRVITWGYCTGGTLSMLAAGLDRRLAAAVLFFPSQPTFEERTPKRPVSAMDMIWNIAGPVLVHYGEADKLMPPQRQADLRQRFAQWGVDYELHMYPDAGHAFATELSRKMYNAAAAKASWANTLAFLDKHLGRAG